MEAQKPRSCLSDAFNAARVRDGSLSATAPRAIPEPVRRNTSPAAASRCYTFSGYDRSTNNVNTFATANVDLTPFSAFRSMKDMSNSLEASKELQQILSHAHQSNRSSIFGCSPPVRADNPVIHDSTFGSGSMAEQSCGAFCCSAYNLSVGFDCSPASALSTA